VDSRLYAKPAEIVLLKYHAAQPDAILKSVFCAAQGGKISGPP
jgi:hypothetical protein